jgi:acyl carrier protein
MDTTTSTINEVTILVAETLGIVDRLPSLNASTSLLGNLPELDSLGIAELTAGIEDKFGFEIDLSDVTIDIFETVGTLADFVDANRP